MVVVACCNIWLRVSIAVSAAKSASFIRDFALPNGAVIAETIIHLGKKLGLATIAEGIETQEQADAVKAMGCDEVQGFVFSKPLPAQELQQMLQQQPFSLSRARGLT